MWRPVNEDELQRYVDNKLDESRALSVEAFLEANPEEARRVEDYCRLNDMLQSLGEEIDRVLPPEGELRLKAMVRHRLGQEGRILRCGTVALALLAAMGVGAAGEAYWRSGNNTPVAAIRADATVAAAAKPVATPVNAMGRPTLADDRR